MIRPAVQRGSLCKIFLNSLLRLINQLTAKILDASVCFLDAAFLCFFFIVLFLSHLYEQLHFKKPCSPDLENTPFIYYYLPKIYLNF
ncbi:hypothetical protein BpHYR1_034073 [Brachionus plicatilis]|uniref:Uncharacterized protein n=1 Tax=Brachionus plicatilis TaxID=10195 RepID=A0A3M7R9A4_BRAPC|nr:hypothetical protein BpHYR1_034073 [Brachionus plicatilis]